MRRERGVVQTVKEALHSPTLSANCILAVCCMLRAALVIQSALRPWAGFKQDRAHLCDVEGCQAIDGWDSRRVGYLAEVVRMSRQRKCYSEGVLVAQHIGLGVDHLVVGVEEESPLQRLPVASPDEKKSGVVKGYRNPKGAKWEL